jgi:uncharacterized protein YneF (UPF0154 family)
MTMNIWRKSFESNLLLMVMWLIVKIIFHYIVSFFFSQKKFLNQRKKEVVVVGSSQHTQMSTFMSHFSSSLIIQKVQKQIDCSFTWIVGCIHFTNNDLPWYKCQLRRLQDLLRREGKGERGGSLTLLHNCPRCLPIMLPWGINTYVGGMIGLSKREKGKKISN